MTRFKAGDIVRCKGVYFAERKIIGINLVHGVYMTQFTDDGSFADTNISVIDSLYELKKEG